MTVTLFVPCFVDLMFPKVGISMVRILERLGHKVECPEDIACCGQPAYNSGYWEEARTLAATTLERLKDAEVVVIGSGSCGAMLHVFYPELFAGTPQAEPAKALANKCFEFSDFLVTKLGVTDVGARFPAKVTFHDGCHGLRELHTHQQPRRLLANVRDLELIEMKEQVCCGFGGTFSVKYGEISNAILQEKLTRIANSGVEFVVANDSSCLMQIAGGLSRAGSPVKTMHLAELLAKQ